MFSSNQILDITAKPDDLTNIIKFVVELYGADIFTREESPVSMAFAEPILGVFAIGCGKFPGWKKRNIPGHPAATGWTNYPFKYTPEGVAFTVKSWLQNLPKDIIKNIEHTGTDGSEELGVRVRSIYSMKDSELMSELRKTNWAEFWCIACFTPHQLAYDK